MAMPDKIEDVNAEQLISIVETDPFVTGRKRFKKLKGDDELDSSFLL